MSYHVGVMDTLQLAEVVELLIGNVVKRSSGTDPRARHAGRDPLLRGVKAGSRLDAR